VFRVLDFRGDNFPELLFVGNLEGQFSCQQFIDHNTQCPDIDFVVICFAHEQFGRHIERSATKSLPFLILRVDAPAKITQLRQLKRHDYILWLDVAMNDILLV
jgi:hypothetical protein